MVTGASDGIGKAIALSLAAEGFSLVLAGRSRDRLDAVASAVSAAGGQVIVVPGDLARQAGLNALFEAAAPLDVGLVVLAAGFGSSGAFLDGDVDHEREMVRLNCESVMLATHHFAPRLVARGRGGIILMSSLVAFQGVPWAAHYAATKAYVQSLAEGLRRELAPRGVDVLASAPGPVSTGFATRATMTMGKAERPEVVARQTLAALGRQGTVRPGFLSKLLHGSLAPLPRWGRVLIMEKVMRGMAGRGHGENAVRG
ncbi:SDR family NAD(P)-dependent oxidoreductase [Phreatobacter sp.]|uniref:SDR family NAD(P)-dependent oxidoreductase n=1 Tax=Phreatobacter sp. TaxID=1966341 RepID=UPI0022BE54F7|nr:SDR family NAD(P)-dependent oxidoreductase [Phreatobacter sp.]MCZ8314411.1 SDR family NAD(P)-dependent oxidoreductase [Phreatobacter sp.]